jgi:hypothetical protein
MTTKDKYVAPEIKYVGEVDDVVLGLGGVGPDLGGEAMAPDFEFEMDEQ